MNDQQTPAGTPERAPTSDGQDSHQGAADGAARPGWGSDHPVNIRLTIPLLFRKYYITIVAGSAPLATTVPPSSSSDTATSFASAW